jgi:aminoglycoside phosphotransferase (APT) family kinase protein
MSAAELNVAALADWMDAHRAGVTGPVTRLRLLAGGTQNRLFAFHHATQPFVLRLPPARGGGAGDATILREARLLGALSATAIPHPRLLAAEHDPALLGAAFYVSAYVPGRGVTDPGLARSLGRHARIAITRELARTLGALGEIDPIALGLAEFGRPDGFLDRQVDRWLDQLDRYRGYPGYASHDLPHIETLSSWLRERVPPAQRPGIIHGDLHLGNVLIDSVRPGVAALVDWELATIGDPLLDLGELIATWPDDQGRSALGAVATPAAPSGWPPHRELVTAYREASTRDLAALDWYVIMAGFRLAILLEGSRARARAGLGSPQVGDDLHRAAVILLKGAARRADPRQEP